MNQRSNWSFCIVHLLGNMGSIIIKSSREPIWRKSLIPFLQTKYFEVKPRRLREFLQILAFSSKTKQISEKNAVDNKVQNFTEISFLYQCIAMGIF